MATKKHTKQTKVKKEKVKNPNGKVFVYSSFNNTIVTITDMDGNTLTWASAGKMEFKGSRKSTPYAAQLVAKQACQEAIDRGLNVVSVFIKGPGMGREGAIRSIVASGLNIIHIKDITPVPHNGCRPPKKRRI